MDLAPVEWMPMTLCAIWRGVTHVAADPITVINMNALCSMISEYERNRAITNNAKKITCRTARPGRKILGGCGAGTRTPAASNRASMSMAQITRAVPNIRFNTNLPFTAIHTAGWSPRWTAFLIFVFFCLENGVDVLVSSLIPQDPRISEPFDGRHMLNVGVILALWQIETIWRVTVAI